MTVIAPEFSSVCANCGLTHKPFVVSENCDFEAERARCLRLIDELAGKQLESDWPPSPVLGRMSGRDVTRLHAKHLNHHLTQFGAQD